MLSKMQILAWGERWHYPALVLERDEHQHAPMLKYGKEAYEQIGPLMVPAVAKRIAQIQDPAMHAQVLYFQARGTNNARKRVRRLSGATA